ncbi:MAG: thioesterase family protein [Hyphomicrobiales bacterium]
MELNVESGIKGIEEKEVLKTDTAAAYGSGLIEVFATPAMIALMEMTCCQSVQKHLPEGLTTVGTEVKIKHTKATPLGMKVKCESELTEVDGKRLEFSVKAYDEQGLIGEGTHQRFIINEKKFMERISK